MRPGFTRADGEKNVSHPPPPRFLLALQNNMALFRASAKDGVSLPFVFQSAQSASTTPLVALSFRNKDEDTHTVYDMASIDVYDSGAAGGDSTRDGFGALAISTASNGEVSEVARFTDRNFVGVNTPDPQAHLHVVGGARFDGGAFTVSNADVSILGGGLFVDGVQVGLGGGASGSGLEGVVDYDDQSGLLTISTLGAPRLHVTGAGDLGVGTDAPSSELHVVGTASADGLSVRSNAAIATPADPLYALKVAGDVAVDGVLAVSSPADRRLALSADGDAEFSGSVGIGVASPSNELHVGGSARVDGKLRLGGIDIPDGQPDQIIAVAGAGDGLKYIHPHTDTIPPALAALVAGPRSDFEASAAAQDAPVFAVQPAIDTRSYSVRSAAELDLLEDPDARLLLLLSLITTRTDGKDQTLTTALRAGGAQMGATLNTCHSSGSVNNYEHTAFAGGFYAPDAARTATVRTRKVLDPEGGVAGVGAGTRVLGLRFDGSDAYFGQSTGLSDALTSAPAPAAIGSAALADAGTFAPVANGFTAQADATVLVLGGAATAGDGDLMRTRLEVNGAAANSHDYYTGASDGPGSVSFAQVLTLAAGDAVRVTNATYGANAAALESVSLSAGAVAAADAAQVDGAAGLGGGAAVPANTFFGVPLPGASAMGASFSQGADSLVTEAEGLFLVLATVSVEGVGGAGLAGANVRLLLNGFTNLHTGACLWDRGAAATVPVATAVELPAGSRLSLDLTCSHDCSVFDACLCAVRLENSYPPDPTLLTFGSYYKRAALGSDFQNDTQEFREAFALLTGEVPSGLYRISFHGQLRRISDRTAEYRIVLDDASVLAGALARVSPPAGNEISRAHSELAFLTPGRHKVALQHRSAVSDTTALLSAGASLEIYRIR